MFDNLHFADNQKKDEYNKGFKVRPVTKHFNGTVASVLGNSKHQSIDEHMCKFNDKSRMKQYIKLNGIKWLFKYWYRCDNNTGGYVYQ